MLCKRKKKIETNNNGSYIVTDRNNFFIINIEMTFSSYNRNST